MNSLISSDDFAEYVGRALLDVDDRKGKVVDSISEELDVRLTCAGMTSANHLSEINFS